METKEKKMLFTHNLDLDYYRPGDDDASERVKRKTWIIKFTLYPLFCAPCASKI